MAIDSPDIKWCGLSRRPAGYTQTYAQFYPEKQNGKITLVNANGKFKNVYFHVQV